MAQAILLSGDHASLPRAELQALVDVHGGAVFEDATTRIATADAPEAAARLVQQWAWGDLWAQVPDDEAAFKALANQVGSLTDGAGSAAVRVIRYGHAKSPHRRLVERIIGGALEAAGHSIDLLEPDHEIFAWLGEGRLAVGLQRGTRPMGFNDRALERRAHFMPVSLDPRRAASLVHLARPHPGATVYDPFCGTGGIVLEAALMGFHAMGSDLDHWMVQGTMQALTDAGPEALDGDVFHADIGDAPAMVGSVDAIVTDLPYGAASSTHDEQIGRLYARAFEAFAAMLPAGRFAVVGHKDPALLESASDHGFTVHEVDGRPEVYEEFIHKSLTRRYAVLRRL